MIDTGLYTALGVCCGLLSRICFRAWDDNVQYPKRASNVIRAGNVIRCL